MRSSHALSSPNFGACEIGKKAAHEGDMLKLLGPAKTQRRIRIGASDAPEKGEDFGGQSHQHLTRLALDKHVPAECPKTDQYGRKVCRMSVHGLDVGAAHRDARAVGG